MKDIFVDTQIANKYFPKPIGHFEEFVKWLQKRDVEHPENDAYLVVSPYLITEYFKSSSGGSYKSGSSITAIYNLLQSQGRLNPKSKQDIEAFQKKHFTPTIKKAVKKAKKDCNHIPIIFLSNRKLALIEDKEFCKALNCFNKFHHLLTVAQSPEKLPYK